MKNIFSKKELLFICTLGFALGIRQMAMTMVMPFISIYGGTLKNSTPILVGLALGIFGLMQAIFQIPFGIWSDKIGNKPVILVGLMQVIIGLVMACFATSIYVLILARALQGSGAIIAVGYSWVSSSVDSKKTTRALSIVGVILGFAATASFALGPLIHRYLSVNKMFLYCAVLIFIAWVIILLFLKEETIEKEKDNTNIKKGIKILVKNHTFITLNLGAFFNNFVMSAVFFSIPQYLEKITGIDGMWKVFMPSVIIAIICMKQAVKFAEKGYSIQLLIISFIITAAGICFYFNKDSFSFILSGTILFMIGYICINTIVPSNANNMAEDSYRGTINGIVNSFQYIGSFIGSVVAAAIWQKHEKALFILLIIICIFQVYILRKCLERGDKIERQNSRIGF